MESVEGLPEIGTHCAIGGRRGRIIGYSTIKDGPTFNLVALVRLLQGDYIANPSRDGVTHPDQFISVLVADLSAVEILGIGTALVQGNGYGEA